jgi:hypothetical protein
VTSEIAAASAQEACDSQNLFEHRAILCTSDNKPFSEVNELYQGAGFSVSANSIVAKIAEFIRMPNRAREPTARGQLRAAAHRQSVRPFMRS